MPRWYVHVNAARADGTKDAFQTRGFDCESEARAYMAEVLADPDDIWEAEIQGRDA